MYDKILSGELGLHSEKKSTKAVPLGALFDCNMVPLGVQVGINVVIEDSVRLSVNEPHNHCATA